MLVASEFVLLRTDITKIATNKKWDKLQHTHTGKYEKFIGQKKTKGKYVPDLVHTDSNLLDEFRLPVWMYLVTSGFC